MNWLPFAIAGMFAQLVDGTVGMGFGVTSSTILLVLGASASMASAAVHLAEIGTTLASGFSHWHRENVDFKILKKLAIPGGIGAFLGATLLSSIDLSKGKTFISTILLLLGFVLIYRNIFSQNVETNLTDIKQKGYLSFLGFTGGFVDASGGGGWGPVVTPTLLTTTSTEPKKVIGTVSASEFIVAICASAAFLINLGESGIDWSIVLGLAAGGVLMAPIAARFVGRVKGKTLGIFIGAAIVLINGFKLIGL
ncbi:MAG: hypothetical protein RL448_620 [Actinomycetota bacterium]